MNFAERYEETIRRYNDPNETPKMREFHERMQPLEVGLNYWESDDGEEIEINGFYILSFWGEYYFNLDGSFYEYITPTWLDND